MMVDANAPLQPGLKAANLGDLPVAVLIDELKNEDVTLRLNSIERLQSIALALGEERTRQELLPFLMENHDDDDVILLALAAELNQSFVRVIGGPRYAYCMLPILETLAVVDETVVRAKAAESMIGVGEVMVDEDFKSQFVPVVGGLMKKEWTARVSATKLLSLVYEKSKNDEKVKKMVRDWFVDLSQDETPMVRRASAQAFAKLVMVIEPKVMERELLPVFQKLTEDDQDSVRLISVESCGALSEVLAKGHQQGVVNDVVVPIVLKFAGDQSWRVRHQAALQLADVAESSNREVVRSLLLTSFVALMQDSEAEVRAVAASCVSKFSQLLRREDVTSTIIPMCQDLANDASQYVRISLAGSVTELSPLVGKDFTSQELLPIYLELLKDENSETRLGIIGKLDSVGKVIGVDVLSTCLMPAIEELAKDEHWRVRLAIISHVPLLAQQIGEDFLRNQLMPQCLMWLQDKVFSIREAAIETLAKLTGIFGGIWAEDNIISPVLSMISDNSNYLYRITGLHAIAALALHLDQGTIDGQLIPKIIKAATSDPVPNVRFNAAKAFLKVRPNASSSAVQNMIRPCLEEVKEADTDPDVRYFAAESLRAM
jgi:serine/threonine-protein phosphatase 2A regulatory subunit A